MAPQDLSVIRHHAAWVLGVDPEAGLEAFVQMRPPLPPAVVLPILQVLFWVGGGVGLLGSITCCAHGGVLGGGEGGLGVSATAEFMIVHASCRLV